MVMRAIPASQLDSQGVWGRHAWRVSPSGDGPMIPTAGWRIDYADYLAQCPAEHRSLLAGILGSRAEVASAIRENTTDSRLLAEVQLGFGFGIVFIAPENEQESGTMRAAMEQRNADYAAHRAALDAAITHMATAE